MKVILQGEVRDRNGLKIKTFCQNNDLILDNFGTWLSRQFVKNLPTETNRNLSTMTLKDVINVSRVLKGYAETNVNPSLDRSFNNKTQGTLGGGLIQFGASVVSPQRSDFKLVGPVDNLTSAPLIRTAGEIVSTTLVEAIRCTFGSGNGTADFTQIANYVIQSGDEVRFDIFWSTSDTFLTFDYLTSDSFSLCGSAVNDQNGLSACAGTTLTQAVGAFYSRTFIIPSAHVGKTITQYNIAHNSSAVKVGFLKNIRITGSGGSPIRVNIFPNAGTVPNFTLGGVGSFISGAAEVIRGIAAASSPVYGNNNITFASSLQADVDVAIGEVGCLSRWLDTSDFKSDYLLFRDLIPLVSLSKGQTLSVKYTIII